MLLTGSSERNVQRPSLPTPTTLIMTNQQVFTPPSSAQLFSSQDFSQPFQQPPPVQQSPQQSQQQSQAFQNAMIWMFNQFNKPPPQL